MAEVTVTVGEIYGQDAGAAYPPAPVYLAPARVIDAGVYPVSGESQSPTGMCKHGGIVQFYSKMNGNQVRIVLDAAGKTILDARGFDDGTNPNTLWKVEMEKGEARFCNELNGEKSYLVITGGNAELRNYGRGKKPTNDSLFKLHLAPGNFLMLNSKQWKDMHVGFNANGDLTEARETGPCDFAHLIVRKIK